MNLSRKKDVDVKYAGKWVFYFVLIGVMSGLGAILFHYLCGLGMHYFMDMMAGYRPEGSAGEHLLLPHTDTPFNKWVLLFLPALGGIIRARIPIIKTIASTITLTTGGSVGREGPIAQIGGIRFFPGHQVQLVRTGTVHHDGRGHRCRCGKYI